MQEFQGRVSASLDRTYERAIAAADIAPGALLKRTSAGTVQTAGAGDFVVGVATNGAETGGHVIMQVGGEVVLKARSGAAWASGRKVRAAANSEVDQGSTERHHLGRLIRHDTDEGRAFVAMRAGRPTCNEVGEVDNDLDFDAALLVKRYALMMSL